MTTTTSIRPSDISEVRAKSTPDIVFETFNTLIAQNFHGTRSTVKQGEVMNILTTAGLRREEIFAKNWLDVENHYRKAGWIVTYDSPDYTENFDPYFVFKKK